MVLGLAPAETHKAMARCHIRVQVPFPNAAVLSLAGATSTEYIDIRNDTHSILDHVRLYALSGHVICRREQFVWYCSASSAGTLGLSDQGFLAFPKRTSLSSFPRSCTEYRA